MPPNSMNFIMPHHHSLLPLPLLILLLSPAVTADNNTVSPNCGLPLEVCGDGKSTKVLRLGNQTWCRKEEAMDSMGYSEIIINDTDFRKVLDSRNCSDLFNYKLTIPSGSPITSFRFPFPDNTVIYKCNPGFKITWPDQHHFEHPCPDIDFDIFLVDHELPWHFEGCVVLKIPFLMNPGSYPFPENTDILDVLTAEASIHGKLCSKDRRRVPKATIIGIAIGCASLFSVGLFIIVWSAQDRSIYFDIDHPSTDQECLNDKFGVPVFSYEELKTATNNFDPSRELGHGGFGTVYYGKLQDVREVAIKRLYSHKRDKKHVKQFMNEIQILTHLRHRNLVSLYGCSSPQSHALMLVYEYIPNGTVASHLHGDLANSGSLPWPIRMRISIETASALTYLHAIGIIHRDVKTNNILLDKHLCIKVADFGISRLLPNDLSHVTTAPVGTLGYMDPEYHHSYQLTNKSDVYSFGVVLVELISSMRAVDVRRNSDEIKLANLAIKKIQRREFSELVDPSLGFESDNEVKKMVLSVANLAFQCLQRNKELRPSMHDVLEKLQKIESEKGELEHPEVHGIRILERGSHTVPSTSLDLILDYNEVGSLNNLKSHQSLHQTL